jgi:hypothetical protein
MYPNVSLEDLPLDETLARRLSRQLAYYHLALPIGIDDEGITVAMAQPDNVKAREIIQYALGQPVIPVRSEAEQIRRLLDTIWHTIQQLPWLQITTSNNDPVVDHYARQFADIYGSQIISDGDHISEDTLFIRRFSEALSPRLLSSTLLVNRIVQPITHILHLVRLHTPDQAVVSSLVPLAEKYASKVVLLPDTGVVSGNLAYLTDRTTPQGQHLEKIRRQLDQQRISGELRLRQGVFIEIIQAEMASRAYDLVAVAADAYGEIVEGLTDVTRPYHIPAMLVIKPSLWMNQSTHV